MGIGAELKQGFHEVPLWGWGALGIGTIVLFVYTSRKKAAAQSQGGVTTSSPLNVPMVPATTADQSGLTGLVNYMAGVDSQNTANFQALQQSLADETALIAQLQQAGQTPGPAGPPGVPGPTGATGETGATGATGATGDTTFIPSNAPPPSIPLPGDTPVPYVGPTTTVPIPAPPTPLYYPTDGSYTQLPSGAITLGTGVPYDQQLAANLALLNQVNPQNAANVAGLYPALSAPPPPPPPPPITTTSYATPVNNYPQLPVSYSQPTNSPAGIFGATSYPLPGYSTPAPYVPPPPTYVTDPTNPVNWAPVGTPTGGAPLP